MSEPGYTDDEIAQVNKEDKKDQKSGYLHGPVGPRGGSFASVNYMPPLAAAITI